MKNRELLPDDIANDPWSRRRNEMVDHQLRRRGVSDPEVLAAMRTVPREQFVPREQIHRSYDDGPLPIGRGQTISQPFIVAIMAQLLQLATGDRALEIGTGSGYAAAVMSLIAKDVWTIERHEDLAIDARDRLARLGYDNVHVVQGDGSKGHPDAAPYDAIVAAAGSPKVPESLTEQLSVGGRLVLPVGPSRDAQTLVRLTKTEDGMTRDMLEPVRFVPLVGEEGWSGRS